VENIGSESYFNIDLKSGTHTATTGDLSSFLYDEELKTLLMEMRQWNDDNPKVPSSKYLLQLAILKTLLEIKEKLTN